MSIPLDRLYHFIEQIAGEIHREPVIIYRFWPHGSKNIQNLRILQTVEYWSQSQTRVIIYCNDQDPLFYEFLENKQYVRTDQPFKKILRSCGITLSHKNLNINPNIYQNNLLLHSEKRSSNVEKYINCGQFIPVYYWSHALIARDWFRYAEHRRGLIKNVSKKLFLLYNRAWGGTREYRLKFLDLLIEHELVHHCLTFFNPIDNDNHYEQHTFDNIIWRHEHVLENYFQRTTADSSYSADFDLEDYQSTEIEVVLETLFDDDRLHLTEKTLRPIACGQPFILAATHGSLQYLREYGFQTYDSVWDETYDTIQDPYQRMQAIIHLMLEITARSPNQRCKDARRIQHIADYNHKHFFSKDFADIVAGELRTNMKKAFDQIKQDPGFEAWQDRWKCFLQFPQVQDFLDTNQNNVLPTRPQYEQVLEFIKQYPKTIADVNKI